VLAQLRSGNAYMKPDNQGPIDTVLEVDPAGHEHLESILITALIMERLRFTRAPPSQTCNH
jgi:hypothetical protein